MKTVLVTGIGGGVGQGILRNLRAEGLDIALVGTDVSAVSGGNHLCDSVHVVPYAYDPSYTDAMKSIVALEGIDLIIPSTDYEVYFLMLAQEQLGATVAASPASTTSMCLDKYVTAQQLLVHGIPFAKSSLPSSYSGGFRRTVVKPRKGRGSRGIHVDAAEPGSFSDDFVIQEYLDGPELTTCFYVRRDGTLHGLITFVRDLDHGNTSQCEVVDQHDGELRTIIESLVARFDFRGSCNIQSRATAHGVIPFEINCRISGTNSIRSQFGFRDVAYTVQEYLFGRDPETPDIKKGCAIRVMMDVVYPGRTLASVANRHDNFRIF